MSNTEEQRRVWIGCLACYNAGALIGGWYPANEAGEVTTQRIHDNRSIPYAMHEELWCFDAENMPVRNEMSPVEAQRIAELCDAIEDDNIPVKAVVEWTLHTGETFSQLEWDAPTREEFGDAYRGEWDNQHAYVEHELTETGVAAKLEAIRIDEHSNGWTRLDVGAIAHDWFMSSHYSEPAEPDDYGTVTTIYVFTEQ